jgi:hypothetical protein
MHVTRTALSADKCAGALPADPAAQKGGAHWATRDACGQRQQHREQGMPVLHEETLPAGCNARCKAAVLHASQGAIAAAGGLPGGACFPFLALSCLQWPVNNGLVIRLSLLLTQLGSISDNGYNAYPRYGYRASQAALNMCELHACIPGAAHPRLKGQTEFLPPGSAESCKTRQDQGQMGV